MLTPDQIQALGDQAAQLTVAMEEYLIRDIARRVREAEQLTSTAAYQIWRAQRLGLSRRQIERMLRHELKVSHRRLRELLTQSAKVGYDFDIAHLPRRAVPFEKNTVLQQVVAAAVELAKKDFTNLTQTLGLVAPDGKAYPLRKAYWKVTDFAFQQVITGAADHQTALRQATQKLADYGLRSVDYQSGVHTSLEAAVRRNILGGLGLMQEKISQQNHDLLEADGWEISAHAASAPDHEPIQGRQYSDEEYQKLNDSLARRIGTLNCGHAAFPILLGVSQPQYTEAELARLREENAKGIRYEGKLYTLYQATQKQRELERAIRRQKRRVMAAEETGDQEGAATAKTRLTLLRQRYREFSKAAGLRTQEERTWVADTGMVANTGRIRYTEKQAEILQLIRSSSMPKTLNIGNQNKHIVGANGYIEGRSIIYGGLEQAQELVDRYSGTGEPKLNQEGEWTHKEFIVADVPIGIVVNQKTLERSETKRFAIHYGKKGTHIVPAEEIERK